MVIPRDVCVVFADVSGSTRLYETLGDHGALAAVESCLAVMTEVTRLNRGHVVKTIGDEVMALFATAAKGLQAAAEMQRGIDELTSPAAGVRLAIRVGAHHGPVLCEGNDVFGDTVNTAARLTELAKPGQILTSAQTVAALPEDLRTGCREIDALALKGKAGNVTVCEMVWQPNAELTMLSARLPLSSDTQTQLRLQYGGTALLLGPARPVATLGRDPASDIVIRDPHASRQHARIERRRDKFVLVDVSSNGTYITFRGETEIVLKREEALLRGSGRIVFGHAATAGDEILRFAVAG